MASKTTTIVLSGLLLLGSLGMVAGTAAAETANEEAPVASVQIDKAPDQLSDAELIEAIEAELDTDLPEDAEVFAVQTEGGPVGAGVSTTNSHILCVWGYTKWTGYYYTCIA